MFSPIVEGEVKNSAIFNGEVQTILGTYKNRAISQTAIALGGNTISGLKGYYIVYIDFNTNEIWVHNERPQNSLKVTFEWEQKASTNANEVQYSAGGLLSAADTISIICNGRHYNCGEIQSISGNKITLKEPLPFTQTDVETILELNNSITNINRYDELTLFVISKPDVGPVDLGGSSLSEGLDSKAIGGASHTEGYQTVAYGKYSHTEGYQTEAGYRSHAEGYMSKASGENSHTEGRENESVGNCSHSEGRENKAIGENSHAEGWYTQALGKQSHAEGYSTIAKENQSHSEGKETQALGNASHAEGYKTIASGQQSHSEGWNTIASGSSAHVEGIGRVSTGAGSHVEGIAGYFGSNLGTTKPEGKTYKVSNFDKIKVGDIIHTVDDIEVVDKITIEAVYADSESITLSKSLGGNSHSVTIIKTSTDLECFGVAAHVEGSGTISKANFAHAEG